MADLVGVTEGEQLGLGEVEEDMEGVTLGVGEGVLEAVGVTEGVGVIEGVALEEGDGVTLGVGEGLGKVVRSIEHSDISEIWNADGIVAKFVKAT